MSIEIDKVIAIDCETSGINFSSNVSPNTHSVAKGYQALSWGFVIADMKTFKPIDELYVEVKWDGKSIWDEKAEKIHGMSKEYLEENGVDEDEALAMIVEFFMKHLDLNKALYFLGQNAPSFDVPYFKELLARHDFKGIKIAHRQCDTFALSMGTVQEFDSDTLFKRVGLPVRKDHNALEDAKYALDTYRRIHKAWTMMLEKS